MTDYPDFDDPDELRLEMELEKKDPIRQMAAMREAIDEIEVHLRHGIPALKFIGWIITILLGIILWRIWRS
jgi:hypothetical protein